MGIVQAANVLIFISRSYRVLVSEGARWRVVACSTASLRHFKTQSFRSASSTRINDYINHSCVVFSLVEMVLVAALRPGLKLCLRVVGTTCRFAKRAETSQSL